jgi:hypothetical protein
VVGMNPIPDHADSPADLIGEMRRARDACILLAGHKPYRYKSTCTAHTHINAYVLLTSENFLYRG